MSNGVRAVHTPVAVPYVTYTYTAPDGTGIVVTITNGVMSLQGNSPLGEFSATLPLTVAPLMLSIAQDMIAETQLPVNPDGTPKA